jgi:hypothetical protein
MFCPACGAPAALPATFCSSCGKRLPGPGEAAPAVPPAPGPAAAGVSSYLVPSILVTIFCCLPPGIVAIVYAAQVNSRLDGGDVPGAERASRSAKVWCWVSFGIGLLGGAGYLLLFLLGVATGLKDL